MMYSNNFVIDECRSGDTENYEGKFDSSTIM